jgi:hypothetical protein
MKKIILLVFSFCFYLGFSGNGGGDKIIFRDTVSNIEDLRVFFDGGLATDEYIKVKVRYENKNDFFILVDPTKCFFYINGAKVFTKEKSLVIPPSAKKTKVFDVKYQKLKDQAISFVMDGFLKTGNEKMISFPDINIPQKKKQEFGNIEVMVTDVDYDKAKKLHLKIKVTNLGNEILILNPGVVELNDGGNTLNNFRKRTSSMMLKKEETETFSLAFATINEGGDKRLIWNDAFVSAALLPMSPAEFGLASNPDLLRDYKSFLSPTKKPEPVVKKEEPIASNKSRAKEKPVKKTENKPAPAVKDKTEVVKTETKRSEIQTEGEMQELHAADVDFSAGGKYYALLIGISDYNDPNIPDLENLPVNDAEALGKVLKSSYTFNPDDINVLKNPTRREIVIALDELSKKATANDNVLIFYAGHGHYEDDSDIGYWLPKDAEVSNSANWLYNDQLTASIRKIKSLHTLLISDACFSGSIFKNRSISLTGATDVIKKKYQLPSRKAITSGTLKTVPNKSVFIKYLLDRLEKNKDKYFSASGLYQALEAPVGNNSTSLPQYGVINNVGDEGGDFIFIRK